MARSKRVQFDDEISTIELATICDLTERRIQQLAELGVFEKLGHGKYRRSGCAAAYKEYCVQSEIDRRSEALTSKDQFEAERARKLKMENDLRERLLVETPDAMAAVDYIFGEVRTELAGIPARVTEDVEERRRLEDGINDVLGSIFDRLEKAGAALHEGRDPLEAGDQINA